MICVIGLGKCLFFSAPSFAHDLIPDLTRQFLPVFYVFRFIDEAGNFYTTVNGHPVQSVYLGSLVFKVDPVKVYFYKFFIV